MSSDSKYVKIKIEKGTTKKIELYFKEDGIGFDITDWTIYMTVKEDMEDADSQALIAKTITSHSEPENGKTLIELSIADTDLTPGSYYYSIDYKDDSDNEGVLFWGHLEISDAVLDSRS